MKVVEVRPGTYSLTATRRELGALVAAARMALSLMEADPDAPAAALPLLRGVLADWDAAIARGGRGAAPAPDPPEGEG